MKHTIRLALACALLSLTACDSKEDKCRRHYIDKEGYSYDEACDQCDAEMDAYYESQARR
jgi:hypothetical protein